MTAVTTYSPSLTREATHKAAEGRVSGALARLVAALTLLLALAVAFGPTRAHAFDLALQNVSGAKGLDWTLMFRGEAAESKQEEAVRKDAEANPRIPASQAHEKRIASAE